MYILLQVMSHEVYDKLIGSCSVCGLVITLGALLCSQCVGRRLRCQQGEGTWRSQVRGTEATIVVILVTAYLCDHFTFYLSLIQIWMKNVLDPKWCGSDRRWGCLARELTNATPRFMHLVV